MATFFSQFDWLFHYKLVNRLDEMISESGGVILVLSIFLAHSFVAYIFYSLFHINLFFTPELHQIVPWDWCLVFLRAFHTRNENILV